MHTKFEYCTLILLQRRCSWYNLKYYLRLRAFEFYQYILQTTPTSSMYFVSLRRCKCMKAYENFRLSICVTDPEFCTTVLVQCWSEA